jgi:hypothetical protein
VTQSDAEIAALLYADSQRTPPNFYADTPGPTTGYVATFHLKNSDLEPAAVVPPHELCTEDWNEALQWSETATTRAATYADLVATDGNSRYFEFGRVPRGQSDTYLRERVYRCTYLDRSTVDLRAAAGAAGRLNRRPLGPADLRELTEYLWLFTSYNNFGNAVLASRAATAPGALRHVLYVATLTRASVVGGCDRIDVMAWTHSANAQSGDLQLERQPLWHFGARQVGTGAELCSL